MLPLINLLYNFYLIMDNSQKSWLLYAVIHECWSSPYTAVWSKWFKLYVVTNIVPPYEKDTKHNGTSAALEFGICVLEVRHLILLGHSQCAGIQILINRKESKQDDFITNWVSIIKTNNCSSQNSDDYTKLALKQSHQNCMSFPWINKKIIKKELIIHLWYFDIKNGEIFSYSDAQNIYNPLH